MYEDWNEEDYLEEEYPNSRAAERRKNEWKYAKRRKDVLDNYGIESKKPLHYYSKNVIKHKNFRDKKFLRNDRQIDDFKNQMEELFDEK